MGSKVAATENTGTLRWTGKGYFAQFSIGKKRRKGTLLRSCKSEAEAEDLQLFVARLVTRLREAGYGSLAPRVIHDAGAPDMDADGRRKLAKFVERIATGKEPGLARLHGATRDGITVSDLADLWTSGDLAKEYPDHVRVKKTKGDDSRQLGWMTKVRMADGTPFGERVVASVKLDDCDHVDGRVAEDGQDLVDEAPLCAVAPQVARVRRLSPQVAAGATHPERLAPQSAEQQGDGLDLPERGPRPDEAAGSTHRPSPAVRPSRTRRPAAERGTPAPVGRPRPRARSRAPRHDQDRGPSFVALR